MQKYEIFNIDCMKHMKTMDDNSVDTIITSIIFRSYPKLTIPISGRITSLGRGRFAYSRATSINILSNP